MHPLSDRTRNFTDSVIRRMTRISNQYNAVNLSQGFPDFDPPEELTAALAKAAQQGPHQYSITWGAQNFRQALAKKHQRFTG
ncbi:MAG: aminotransferase, partial [Lentisphaeria bacterium]|nr:aminotransferase [Lentisphaeria bacterium]